MWAPADLHRILACIVAELEQARKGEFSVHLARANALLAEYDPDATPVFKRPRSLEVASKEIGLARKMSKAAVALLSARWVSAAIAILGGLRAAWIAYHGGTP